MTQLIMEKGLGKITLPMLQQSVNEVSLGQKPMNGIRHAELFTKIDELMTKHNLQHSLGDIYVRDNGPSALPGINLIPAFEKDHGEKAIEAYIIRRLIGKYQIEDGSDKLSNTGIAISYHQAGIQIGYGPNVRICDNFSIFADKLISSTQVRNIEKMFEVLENFLQNHAHNREIDQALIKRMFEIGVSYDDAINLIGDLEVQAVNKAYRKGVISPLNISQVTDFTRKYMDTYDSDKRSVENLFQVYNVGTSLYHPEEVSDITTILPMNQALGKFLMTKYDFSDILKKYKLELN